MRKKHPVPFAQKFPSADPLAVRLLERLLAFDPKDRPTAEQALADPYFKGLAKIEREPCCQPISKLEFEFERRRLTKDDIRELIFREILEYHPQLLKEYINGSQGTNFLYPSALDQFRKQFAHLEENCGKNRPVVPLVRKHVSLPRSTVVHSATILPKGQQKLAFEDRKFVDEICNKSFRGEDAISGSVLKPSRPPPRVPSAKPGRIVGPVIPYENSRDTCDGRIFVGNAVLPSQTVSPHCFLGANAVNSDKLGMNLGNNSTQVKQQPPQYMAAKSVHGVVVDVNTNPYCQPQVKTDQLNDRIAIDANLLHAQSQFGAIGAAAVAVVAHRTVGAVQLGMS